MSERMQMEPEGLFAHWSKDVKKLIGWGVTHWIASFVLFLVLYLVVPGFPFFPKTVFRTSDQESTARLGPGSYYLLFYVEGDQKLAVDRAEVSGVEINALRPDGTVQPVPLASSNFYFDDVPDGVGVRGHSIASFVLAHAEELKITGRFKRYGYDGLLIRTGFRKLIVSVLGFQLIALFLSTFMVKSYWKRRNGRIAQAS